MLTLSMTFGFFMKVAFKMFGATNFNDDQYLTFVASIGFFCAAFSRFFWTVVQQNLGFRKTYATILMI